VDGVEAGRVRFRRNGMLEATEPSSDCSAMACASSSHPSGQGDAAALFAARLRVDMACWPRRLRRCRLFFALARGSVRRIERARQMAPAPNLFCVAGAFVFDLTATAAVVISNLATCAVYNRAKGAVNGR
jgi:hypothetical protein